MKIPFVDLRAQHEEVRPQLEARIKEVIDKSSFVGGELVSGFEAEFANFCGTRQAVTCASGTDALKLALMAAGIGRGDEVVSVANTFIATVEAVNMVGAHFTFVDIDPKTYNLSPERLAEFLEKRCHLGPQGYMIDDRTGRPVKALLPVHLYGQPADMKPLMELADRYRLTVIEDGCQAHGASYRWQGQAKRVGGFGVTAAFSFYPGKNLGAMGEGGAVTTNDDDLARKMRMWRDHGQSEKYINMSPDGWNGRLDALQCAILKVKLTRLDDWNERRRQAAAWYREHLASVERLTLPEELDGAKHVYHLFVVRLENREKVRQELARRDIGVGLHYPIPLHLQPAYRYLGWQAGDLPETEAAASTILSLPMFPHLTKDQVDVVCSSLKEILA